MPGRGLVMTWGGSAVLAALSGLFAAGARVGVFEQRLAVVERETARVSTQHQELERQILEQMRRVEISLAELRAEQRILHQR